MAAQSDTGPWSIFAFDAPKPLRNSDNIDVFMKGQTMKLNSSLKKGAVALALIVGASGCTSSQPGVSPTGEREPAAVKKAVALTSNDILKSASSEALKVSKTRVIIDNDESFFSKYNAIKSAQAGDTVRMVYYIWSNDESSSYLMKQVIERAQAGVKFKILVDLITNYKNLDLFSYLEKAGNGNIEVSLYGRPSGYVVRDALFMTKPCPTPSKRPSAEECANAKWSTVQKQIEANGGSGKIQDFYMNLLLAGLYGRDGGSAKVGLAYGSMLSDVQGQSGPVDADQKKKLRELISLVLDAKIFGKDSAYIKLGFAMVLYANEVNPVLNQLYGRFPFEQPDNKNSFEHWEHLTDYTHHKLLLVGRDGSDKAFMQLGGRNIENSYHMKMNGLSAKYTFMDTDFASEVSKGANSIAKSYDKMWNYKEVVVSLKEIKTFLNNDYARNPQALGAAVMACEQKGLGKKREEMAQCLASETVKQATFKTAEARMNDESAKIETNSKKYETEYLAKLDSRTVQSWRGSGYKASADNNSYWSPADEASASVYYLENLPYTRTGDKRTLNFEIGAEHENNKNIHDLWIKGLQNVCVSPGNKRVILHSAYWFPSTNLMEAFRAMVDGTWDCKGVTVDIVTNSFDTTDLNVLNVFARYQMKAFYEAYDKEYKDVRNRATFRYFEYQKPVGATENQVLSLHTKMSVLGDDVIIGSANADIRSYMMDTNNGVFVRGAKDFVKQYTAWIDGVLADPAQTKEFSNQFRLPLGMGKDESVAPDDATPIYQCKEAVDIFVNKRLEKMPMNLHAQDMCFLEGLAMKFKFLGNLKKRDNGEDWVQLQKLERAISYDIYDTTTMIMSKDYFDSQLKAFHYSEQDRAKRKLQREIEEHKNDFNRKYQTF